MATPTDFKLDEEKLPTDFKLDIPEDFKLDMETPTVVNNHPASYNESDISDILLHTSIDNIDPPRDFVKDVKNFALGEVRTGADMAMAIPNATAQWGRDFFLRLDRDAKRVGEMTGTTPGGIFGIIADTIGEAPTPTTIPGKLVGATTKAALSVAEIMALSKGMGGTPSAMAALGSHEAFAAGEDAVGIAKGGVSGYLLGKIFHATTFMSKLLALPTDAVIMGGLTAQGLAAERGGIENLTPEDKETILIDLLVGAMLALPGTNQPLTFKEIRDTYSVKGFKDNQIVQAWAKFEDLYGGTEQRAQLKTILDTVPEGTPEGDAVRAKVAKNPQFRDMVPDKEFKPGEVSKEVSDLLTQKVAGKETPAAEPGAEPTAKPKSKIVVDMEAQQVAHKMFVDYQAKLAENHFIEKRTGSRIATGDIEVQRMIDAIDADPKRTANQKSAHKKPLLKQLEHNARMREAAVEYQTVVDKVAEQAAAIKIPRPAAREGGLLEHPEVLDSTIPFREIDPNRPVSRIVKDGVEVPIKERGSVADIQTPVSPKFNIVKLNKTAKDIFGKEYKDLDGLQKAEVEYELGGTETPAKKPTFIEPTVRVSEVDTMTTEELATRQSSLESSIKTKIKQMEGLGDDAFMQSKAEVDMLEAELRLVNKKLVGKRVTEIEKVLKELGDDPEAEAILKAADAELEAMGNRPLDMIVNPKSSAKEVKDAIAAVEKIVNTDAPTEFRKGMKPAVRILGTDEILTGKNTGDLAGQVINKEGLKTGIEFGFQDKDLNFYPKSLFAEGLVHRIKLFDTMSLKRVFDILKNDKGGANWKTEVHTWPTEVLKEVENMKKMYKKGMKQAQKEGKSIEDWLREKGIGDDGIESFKRIILSEVNMKTLVTDITRGQQGAIRKLSTALKVDLEEVKKSVGLEGKKRSEMTYEEAKTLVNRLQDMADTANKELPEEQQIKYKMLSDNSDKLAAIEAISSLRPDLWTRVKSGTLSVRNAMQEFVDSPDMVFGRDVTGKGMEFYRHFAKADILTKKALEHIMSKDGFDIDSIESIIKSGTESAKNVALGLEGKVELSVLSEKERGAVTKLRSFYDFAIEKFAVSRVPDPHRLSIIKSLAEKLGYKANENAELVEAKLQEWKTEFAFKKQEMEVLDLWRMKRENYMTHVFDKQFLIDLTKSKLQALENAGSKNNALKEIYRETILKLEGGQLVTYSRIPKSIKFEYFKERQGAAGYQMDAGVAFNTYIKGWLKKMYSEPALQQAHETYKQLPLDLKSYAKEFTSDYMGWNKTSQIADGIKKFEWIRTLGFSPRSAITNATQIVNTLAEGGIYGVTGFAKAFTPDVRAAFRATGLTRDIPQFMYSGELKALSTASEKARYYAGWMFNKVEYANRLHAYSTGIEIARAKGLSEVKGPEGLSDADWSAIEFTHKTQFLYGKAGMPMAMRGNLGVVTQFSSYTVKQMELMYKWSKGFAHLDTAQGRTDATKLLAYVALAQGMKEGAKALGADISNALGLGVSAEHAIKTIQAMSEKDWEEMVKQMQLTFNQDGTGLLPQQFPLLSGPVLDSIEKVRAGKLGSMDFLSTLEPVQGSRMRDFYFALENGDSKRNQFPIYKLDTQEIISGKPTELKYNLTLGQLLSRTLFAKPYTETVQQRKQYEYKLTKDQEASVVKGFVGAIEDQDGKKIERLSRQYAPLIGGIDMSTAMQNRLLKMNLDQETRRTIDTYSGTSHGNNLLYLNEKSR